MKFKKLGFHKYVLPALIEGERLEEEAMQRASKEGPVEVHNWCDMAWAAKSAVLFDCRKLDMDFVMDTWRAAFEEAERLKQKIRLPFESCYFMLDGANGLTPDVLAYEEEELHADLEAAEKTGFTEFPGEVSYGTRVCVVPFFPNESSYENGASIDLPHSHGEFANGTYEHDGNHEFFMWRSFNPVEEMSNLDAGHALVGVLTLLSEKLLSTQVLPDPCPRLNAAREKRGRPPISDEVRVLTLNLAEVRRVAQAPVGTHESPRLHWRRGHDRVVHRGSEFEKKTWVRRCLVGDPDRGFVHKDYRIAWQVPMLRSSSPN